MAGGAPERGVPFHSERGPRGSTETWFGIIARQSIRRGTFTSVKVLVKQIRDYIARWNTNPNPFVWTVSAEDILAKVRLAQANVTKLVDNNAK